MGTKEGFYAFLCPIPSKGSADCSGYQSVARRLLQGVVSFNLVLLPGL
jgi:hypothetical protein